MKKQESLECGCVVTITSVRIKHSSIERNRRIVCPHEEYTDILTKSGEYTLSVETVSQGTIESSLIIPA